MKVTLSEVQPNPHRNMDNYPVNPEKIKVLRESIRTTGFWENIVGRINDGKPEIAYGHHRILALKEEFGTDYKFNLIVRKLDEATMLKMMLRENAEVYSCSAQVEQEGVKAVLIAAAEGKIELPEPERVTKHISDYILITPGRNKDWAISDDIIAGFTGLSQQKTNTALRSIASIREGILKEGDFDGVTSKQAQVIQTEVSKAKKLAPVNQPKEVTEKKVRDVAETLKEGFKSGEISKRTAPAIARAIRERDSGEKPPADINDVCSSLSKKFHKVLHNDHDNKTDQLIELIRFRKYIDANQKKNLVSVLESLGERCLNYASELSGEAVEMKLISGGE
jgi:ParB-like chromosome segregation protein Spo0J